MKGHTGNVRRTLRLWLPDHNPLRRATDRLQAIVVAAVLLLFLVAAPILAITAARWEHASVVRTQQAGQFKVSATLRTSAPSTATGIKARFNDGSLKAKASWVAPDGTTHTGLVPVSAGARAGTSVAIWVTASGRLTQPPLAANVVADRSWLAAGFSVAALGVAVAGTLLIVRVVFDRRRMAAWGADWRYTEPRWTKKQQH